MKVERIDHVGIYVKDLDKAVDFFGGVLGFEFSRVFGAEGMGVREVVDTLGLDLLAAKSADGPVGKVIEHRGEGPASFSLKVPDIEAGIAEMLAKGIRMVHRGNHGDTAKWVTFHPKDTFGVFIELVEYKPRNPYLSACNQPADAMYPQKQVPLIKVEKIDHVGIYVKDLEPAVKFFEEMFELEFSEPFGPEDEDAVEVMDPLGVNLMASKTPDGPVAKLVAHRGEGLGNLTFKVSNIEKAIEVMKSQNIRMVSRGTYSKDAKWATFHPKDTFGVFINLVEYHVLQPYLACFEEFQPR